MDKIVLTPTDVRTRRLGLKAADGTVEAIPAGDVFSVASTMPAVVPGVIGTDADGNPTLTFNALTQPSAATMGMVLSVSDSNNDVVLEIGVDYPVLAVPGEITADAASEVVTTQAAPTVPGP
jgi:hypothetical protein